MQAKQTSQREKTRGRDVMPANTCRKPAPAKVIRLAVPGQKAPKQAANYDFSGIAG